MRKRFLVQQLENDCKNSKKKKKKKNKEHLRFSTLFSLTQLSLKLTGIVCQQLNMTPGPGKATVQV